MQPLDIKPFFKATNKFQYLEYSSAHPKDIFSSLIKGELTRLLRAYSTYKKVSLKHSEIETTLTKDSPTGPLPEPRQITQERKNKHTIWYFPQKLDLDTKSLRNILKPNNKEGNVPSPCLSLNMSDNFAKKTGQTKPTRSCPPIPKPWSPVWLVFLVGIVSEMIYLETWNLIIASSTANSRPGLYTDLNRFCR